ncbi:MAG: family 20 glycosylhydrolase [Saprospiraceae bacterium]
MKIFKLVFFIICIGLKSSAQNPNQIQIIPIPVNVRAAPGNLKLSEIRQIIIQKNNPELKQLTEQYKQQLSLSNIKVIESKSPKFGKVKAIILSNQYTDRKPDYYSINITKNGILINAQESQGIFYALQSLIQLSEPTQKSSVPFLVIEDYSRFPYRGMHLDVSRHFFPVSFIKEYIDLLARYKFNKFHWHLTDDQGWRIEIKKYPLLTEIGSIRKETLIGAYGSYPIQYDKTEYGGFYTQEEIVDIVQYAKDKFIEIIPEIEMPGHSAALLAAYPQFGCNAGPYEVATTWGVSNNVLCPTDTTLNFMKDILDEVCDLFPGKYIHVGGDEVLKEEWKKSEECTKVMRRQKLKTYEDVQSYFIRQMDLYLSKKNKVLVGWDEILEGGLSQNAVVMSWRGFDGGIQAAKQRHDVIMTPGAYCYFDHYQSTSSLEPLAIGGYTSLEKVYSFNPIPEDLAVEFQKYIIGAQANVWTEYISSPEQVLYMAFPRAMALAEVNWSVPAMRDYKEFLNRLNSQFAWFKSQNINLSNAYLDLNYSTRVSSDSQYLVFNKPPLNGRILIETDSKEDGINQEYLSVDSILLDKDKNFKAWFQLNDNTLGRSISIAFNKHKSVGKKINISQSPSLKYGGGGSRVLINGIDASPNKFSGSEWLGFDNGKNLDANIDLLKLDTIHSISIQVFQDESAWIYLPESIEIYSSMNNIDFNLEKKYEVGLKPGRTLKEKIEFPNGIYTQFLKIIAVNYGEIEPEKSGGGHGAWLFVGEIAID